MTGTQASQSITWQPVGRKEGRQAAGEMMAKVIEGSRASHGRAPWILSFWVALAPPHYKCQEAILHVRPVGVHTANLWKYDLVSGQYMWLAS